MTREEAIDVYNGLINTKIKEAFEFFAPELAESEDEGIRKGLIELIENWNYPQELFTTKRNIIGYLEKQKEQKPTAEWSAEDKTMLNNLIYAVHMKSISPLDEMDDRDKYKKYEKFLVSLPERFNLQPMQEWNDKDEKRVKQLIYDTEHIRAEYEKRKKELGESFNDELIKDCDEQITWLKSLRPSKDCSDCAKHLEGYISGRCDAENKLLEQFGAIITPEDELHIKSRWKPSEEQMDSLRDTIIQTKGYSYSMYLPEIYEQLKKL